MQIYRTKLQCNALCLLLCNKIELKDNLAVLLYFNTQVASCSILFTCTCTILVDFSFITG